jgi:carbonic anhydrase
VESGARLRQQHSFTGIIRELKMEKFVKGLKQFQKNVFPAHKESFRRLASEQNPDALLVTCADSRIDPALLMQSNPGDLFICRNVGNIIPSHGEVTGGVSATIEYAVTGLGVKDIIICGHSDCGAMKGILYPNLVAKMPSVSSWLKNADAVRSVIEHNYPHLEGKALLRAAIEENIVTQLDNLRTHPSVAARLRKGDLRIHGWIYEIETGHVSEWSPDARVFQGLRELTPADTAGVVT